MKSPEKTLATGAYVAFLVTLLLWFLYSLYAEKLITAMYTGHSIGVLNRLITGQSEWALEYYVRKADRIFGFFLKGGAALSLGFFTAAFVAYVLSSSYRKEGMGVLRGLSQRQLNCLESVTAICLAGIPVGLTVYCLFIKNIPFWFYWDPDTSYMADAVNLLVSGRVHMVTHPGIPCQYVCAVLFLPLYLYVKLQGGDFSEFLVANIVPLTAYFRLSFSLFLSAGIFLMASSVRKMVPKPGILVLSVLVFLTANDTFADTMKINVEPLLILLLGVYLYLFTQMATENDREIKLRKLYISAFITGIMLAVKITAFPVLIVLLLVGRQNIRAFLFVLAGFFSGILPVIYPFRAFGNVIKRMAAEVYQKEIINTRDLGGSFIAPYINGTQIFFLENKECLTAVVILALISAIFLLKFKQEKSEISYAGVFLIAAILGMGLMLRYPTPRYLLVSVFLLLVSGLFSLRKLPAPALKSFVPLLLLVCALLAVLNFKKNLVRIREREEKCIIFTRLTDFILHDPQHIAVASWWIDPMLGPWALLQANSDSGGIIAQPLMRRYPNYFIHGVEERKFVGYSGKGRRFERPLWDYLIYQNDLRGVYARFLAETMRGIDYSVVRHEPQTGLTIVKIEGANGQR